MYERKRSGGFEISEKKQDKKDGSHNDWRSTNLKLIIRVALFKWVKTTLQDFKYSIDMEKRTGFLEMGFTYNANIPIPVSEN